MITIAWYNVVAIIVGILFSIWFYIEDERGSLGAIYEWWVCVKILFILALVVIFYAVWGGIFWW